MSGEVGDARKRNTGADESLAEQVQRIEVALRRFVLDQLPYKRNEYDDPAACDHVTSILLDLSPDEGWTCSDCGIYKGWPRNAPPTPPQSEGAESEVEALTDALYMGPGYMHREDREHLAHRFLASDLAHRFLASDWLARHDAEVRREALTAYEAKVEDFAVETWVNSKAHEWAMTKDYAPGLDGLADVGVDRGRLLAKKELLAVLLAARAEATTRRAEQAPQAPAEDAGGAE